MLSDVLKIEDTPMKKEVKTRLDETEYCLLCLHNIPYNPWTEINDHVEVSMKYFSVCCKLLKLDKHNPLLKMRSGYSFCDRCFNILQLCESMYAQLEEIEASLRKFEMDTKVTIIESTKMTSAKLNNIISNEYRRFHKMAIEDFNPVVRLYKTPLINGCSKHSSNLMETNDNICVEVEIKEETSIFDEDIENDTEFADDWKIHSENEKNVQNTNKDDLSSQSVTEDSKSRHSAVNEDLDLDGSDDGQSDMNAYSDEEFTDKKQLRQKMGTKCQSKRIGRRGIGRVSKDLGKKSKKGRQNRLALSEKEISANRWVYRSIEYFYNEDTNRYECASCGNSKALQMKMRAHISAFHGVDGKWNYAGVKYSFDKAKKRFTCSICKKDFSTRTTVCNHIKYHHIRNRKAIEEKHFQKEMSKGNIWSPPQNKRRINIQRGKGLKPEVDEIEINSSRWSYRSTEYFYNDQTEQYECALCGNSKIQRKKMRAHISDFHGVEGFGKWSYSGVGYSFDKNRFVCSLCPKNFSTRSTLIKHIRGKHYDEMVKWMESRLTKTNEEEGQETSLKEGEKKVVKRKITPVDLGNGQWEYKSIQFTKDAESGHFSCNACSRVRKSWYSMQSHIRECHNDEESKTKNSCPECDKTFGTSYRLKAHLVTHSRNSAFQCEECGEIMKRRVTLSAHIARIHKRRRPHMCEVCGKTFFSRKDCTLHLRTHTKEKPFVCPFQQCSMTFSRQDVLNNHQKSHGLFNPAPNP